MKFIYKKNTLAGQLVTSDIDQKPSLIFLHGAGESGKERMHFLAEALAQRHISSFAFDFTGWGESTGDLHQNSLQNRTHEAQTAIDKFLDSTKPISILACSMAGHTALKLLESNNVQNLILFYPAIYDRNAYDKPFDHTFTEIIRQPFSYRNTDVLQNLETYTSNLFVIIGEKDDVIPKEVITLIDQHSPNTKNKQVITIPEAGHQLATWLLTHPDDLEIIVKSIRSFA